MVFSFSTPFRTRLLVLEERIVWGLDEAVDGIAKRDPWLSKGFFSHQIEELKERCSLTKQEVETIASDVLSHSFNPFEQQEEENGRERPNLLGIAEQLQQIYGQIEEKCEMRGEQKERFFHHIKQLESRFDLSREEIENIVLETIHRKLSPFEFAQEPRDGKDPFDLLSKTDQLQEIYEEMEQACQEKSAQREKEYHFSLMRKSLGECKENLLDEIKQTSRSISYIKNHREANEFYLRLSHCEEVIQGSLKEGPEQATITELEECKELYYDQEKAVGKVHKEVCGKIKERFKNLNERFENLFKRVDDSFQLQQQFQTWYRYTQRENQRIEKERIDQLKAIFRELKQQVYAAQDWRYFADRYYQERKSDCLQSLNEAALQFRWTAGAERINEGAVRLNALFVNRPFLALHQVDVDKGDCSLNGKGKISRTNSCLSTLDTLENELADLEEEEKNIPYQFRSVDFDGEEERVPDGLKLYYSPVLKGKGLKEGGGSLEELRSSQKTVRRIRKVASVTILPSISLLEWDGENDECGEMQFEEYRRLGIQTSLTFEGEIIDTSPPVMEMTTPLLRFAFNSELSSDTEQESEEEPHETKSIKMVKPAYAALFSEADENEAVRFYANLQNVSGLNKNEVKESQNAVYWNQIVWETKEEALFPERKKGGGQEKAQDELVAAKVRAMRRHCFSPHRYKSFQIFFRNGPTLSSLQKKNPHIAFQTFFNEMGIALKK